MINLKILLRELKELWKDVKKSNDIRLELKQMRERKRRIKKENKTNRKNNGLEENIEENRNTIFENALKAMENKLEQKTSK